MRCDIIIITYNQLDYTKACIASIGKNTAYPHRIIVIDNASDDGTRDYLAELSERGKIVLVQNQANEGWVKAVNRGIGLSDAEYICVMNNDTLCYPGWLSEMVRVAESDPRIGMVNPEWQLPKRYLFGANAYYNSVIRRSAGRWIETDWARGFCFLITRALVTRIGGLDLEFSPAYYDDWDYSVRAIRHGFIVARARGAFVWHFKNVSYNLSSGGHEKMLSLLQQKGALFHQRYGFPLRLLFAGETVWDRDQYSALALDILRGQHKITSVSSRRSGINHSNYQETVVPGSFCSAVAGILLYQNARHSKPKRFDLVICPERVKEQLSRSTRLRDTYRFFVPAAAYSSHELLKLVSRLKHEKKQGGA